MGLSGRIGTESCPKTWRCSALTGAEGCKHSSCPEDGVGGLQNASQSSTEIYTSAFSFSLPLPASPPTLHGHQVTLQTIVTIKLNKPGEVVPITKAGAAPGVAPISDEGRSVWDCLSQAPMTT